MSLLICEEKLARNLAQPIGVFTVLNEKKYRAYIKAVVPAIVLLQKLGITAGHHIQCLVVALKTEGVKEGVVSL